MPTSVPPRQRLADLACLALVGAGGAVYGRAYEAMRYLERGGLVPGAASHSAIAQFNYYWSLSRLALTLVAAGVVAAVATTVAARQRPARVAAHPA